MNIEKLTSEIEKIDYKISESAIEIKKNIYLEFDDKNLKHRDLDFGGKKKGDWIENIENTFEILEKKTPTSFSKIKDFTHLIVPYGYLKGIQKSLSYTDQPGVIYVSYQDSQITQAEAIIHETCHTILFLFSNFDKGMLNAYEAQYYSAVQDKPRELHNCFLAFHAFVHVIGFYLEFIKNSNYTKEIPQTIFSTYLKSTSLFNVIQRYATFTIEGKKLFQQLKKSLESSEKKVEKLEKKYKKEFEMAQEEQIAHFEKITQEFKNIKF